MRRSIAWLGALACFTAAVYIIAAAGLPERDGSLETLTITAPIPGAPAPLFRAQLADGSWLALDDLRGNPVILNFWATWCVPCEFEMPELQALYAAHSDDGLRIIGINSGEDEKAVTGWVDRLQLQFDIALDEDLSITTLYAVNGQPTTFVINPDGVVEKVFYGITTRDALESEIAAAIAS
ncbi:MAG: redoxin domain-containing protein [Anaerolineae bacterium]|nr:redoxin domain-containing protein [Anaerolineae bacterium]MCA9908576.1 redoxin domain-containing protein [Anaerolineae bacterium]